MTATAPVPQDHPLMIAWTAYQATVDFANTKKQARSGGVIDNDYVLMGALWAVYEAGFRTATERAASLHESVDPASGAERQANAPGADAMGAIIQYRDLIRGKEPST